MLKINRNNSSRPRLKMAMVMLPILLLAIGYGLSSYSPNSTPVAIKNERQKIHFTNDKLNITGNIVSQNKSIAAPEGKVATVTTPTISPPIKSNAVAYEWEQSGSRGVKPEVRTLNGTSWSAWTPLETIDGGKDGTELSGKASSLVLANNIDQVQFRFTLTGQTNAPSDSISLNDVSLTAIDSTSGPSSKKSIIQSALGAISPVAGAVTAAPKTISRSEWGNPQPDWSEWTPEYERLGRVIVHHTATTESSDSYADVRAIWQYHTYTLGWGDIGYNYIIDSKGNIFEGRYYNKDYSTVNRKEVVAGHAYNNNRGTIGISTIGDYRTQSYQDASRQALTKLIGYKLAPYGLDPTSSSGPFGPVIVGHYQVNETSCPGNNIISQLDNIRNSAKSVYAEYSKYTFQLMDTPRVMRVKGSTYKRNPDTGETVEGPFEIGRDIKFLDKKFGSNGEVYLRTQFDALRNNYTGIDITDLEDIQPTPLPAPKYLELAEATPKVNPTAQLTAEQFNQGISALFVDEIKVNGVTYYRTAFDKANDINTYFEASKLKDPQFVPFDQPRYMNVPADTNKINSIDGSSNDQLVRAGQYRFTSKINLGGTAYYRLQSDTDQNANLAISSGLINEINYQPLATEYHWKTIAKDLVVNKYSPSQQLTLPGQFTRATYPAIKFVESITINGEVYYRTAFDKLNNNNAAFKLADLEDVPYIPFDNPRVMTATEQLVPLNPLNNSPYQTTVVKGSSSKYVSKILINDTWYARTEADTLSNVSRAVELVNLK